MHVSAVGALGDSVTVSCCRKMPVPGTLVIKVNFTQAAFGAKARTIIDDLIEFRGVSWR